MAALKHTGEYRKTQPETGANNIFDAARWYAMTKRNLALKSTHSFQIASIADPENEAPELCNNHNGYFIKGEKAFASSRSLN